MAWHQVLWCALRRAGKPDVKKTIYCQSYLSNGGQGYPGTMTEDVVQNLTRKVNNVHRILQKISASKTRLKHFFTRQ
jgi:hypothetical protein